MPWALILLLAVGIVSPALVWLTYPWGLGLIVHPIFLMTRTDEQVIQMLSRPGRGAIFIAILDDMQRRRLDMNLALPMVVQKMLSRSWLDRKFGSIAMRRFFAGRLDGVDYNPWRLSPAARAHLQSLLTPQEPMPGEIKSAATPTTLGDGPRGA